jgi:hypothetical protein
MTTLFEDHETALRRLRLSHTALGQILDLGEQDGLPIEGMHWLITEWSIVGQCMQHGEGEAAARRAAFEAWSAALGLDRRAERTGSHGVVELRASASNWRGHHLLDVAVWADIHTDLDTEETDG